MDSLKDTKPEDQKLIQAKIDSLQQTLNVFEQDEVPVTSLNSIKNTDIY